MAHMYTTKRGKNKKGKESVRKDQANNQERKLKTAAGPDLSGFAGKDKDKFGVIAGHLMGGGATGVSSSATRIKDRPQDKLKALMEKCHHFKCTKTVRDGPLMACSSCSKVKYCCRQCQVSDWSGGEPPHKGLCKLLKEGEPIPLCITAGAETTRPGEDDKAGTEESAAVTGEERGGDDDEDDDDDDDDDDDEDDECEDEVDGKESAVEGEGEGDFGNGVGRDS